MNFSIKQKADYKSRIRKSLASLGIPVDILLNSEKEIQLLKNVPGHIIRSVTKEMIQL